MLRGGRRGPSLALILWLSFSVMGLVSAPGSGPPVRSGPAGGQAKEAPIQHVVTVTLKLIQVFVTDAKGKPALDLEKSDFAVTDNGRPQAITDFEKHVLALPAAVPAGGQPSVPSPAARTEAPLLDRKFIFLIDYVRNGLEGVQKAKLAALEFLDSKVSPGDEVGLFTLSPISGLTLHEYLTTDHGKVRARLKRLRDSVGGAGDPASGDLMGMELLNAQVFAGHGGHAGPSGRDLFAEIAEWAKALRAIPGQKNIILFSMGFGTGAVRPGRLNNVLFENMVRALASANAPVFAVDTTPQSLPGRDVEEKLPSGTLPERSLAYLSEMTGGKYLGGVNAQARIASDIHEATANYYVLGYAVPAAWDGKYHEVKVEVVRPGHVVHAQRGYFNPVPFGKLTPLEKHLHLLEVALGEGGQAGRPALFPVAALPFPRRGGTGTLLVAELPRDLRVLLGDRVEFVSLVLDEGQAIVDGKRWEVDPEDLKAARIVLYSVAALGPGRYDFRAVLRNLDDGRAAAGAFMVEVPAMSPDEPVMFPPLFLVRGAGANYLDLTPPAKDGDRAGSSISEAFPFPADQFVPLIGELEPGATSLWADLACVWKAERGGERDLSARLFREASGEEIPVTVELLSASSREDRDIYLLGLEFPALAPGAYRLEVRAEGAAAEKAVAAAGRFSVRTP
jgi:VWFA-related protein